MKSCLYTLTIMHERRQPIVRRFSHKVFMFYLSLDEVDMLTKKVWLFGHNQGRIYNYRESDHIGDIRVYLKTKGVEPDVKHIRLLTNVRTFGYIFNPVSFYFCFGVDERPVCAVVEIGNTFHELKYFYLGPEHLKVKAFKDQQIKHYYISPFTDLDNVLDFDIQIPDDNLKIGIDVFKNQQRFFFSSMTGQKREFTNANLIWETIKFPFITFKVIFLIHWHAAILHFSKHLPFHNKEDNPHLQKDIGRQ
jgi:DUF1365 family protein